MQHIEYNKVDENVRDLQKLSFVSRGESSPVDVPAANLIL
jgi:hypothetical protein